jgi:hypothetical protein
MADRVTGEFDTAPGDPHGRHAVEHRQVGPCVEAGIGRTGAAHGEGDIEGAGIAAGLIHLAPEVRKYRVAVCEVLDP